MTFHHNTSYRNGEGQYAMYAGLRHVMRNNVAVPKRVGIARRGRRPVQLVDVAGPGDREGLPEHVVGRRRRSPRG